MHERKRIEHELNLVEQELRELEIRYEQYFAGVEKREPLQNRESVLRRLRQFANRRIIQTDLRFRYQNLSTRYHTYAGYWDRILRLIDEGRYVRQGICQWPPRKIEAPPPETDEVETVYRQLLEAHRSGAAGAVPDRGQVAALLEKQRQLIREKFGDREVEFVVATENGKPRIKVRAKRVGP